jgi:hypothetical protein
LELMAKHEKNRPSRKLTAKQQAFVAYKLAHPTATDTEAAAAACYPAHDRSAPSKVANHPAVRAVLDAQIAKVTAQASLSREGHLSDLQRLRDIAVEQGQVSAAVTAEHYRGKVGGFYVDRIQLTAASVAQMSDEEALAAAKSLGIV